MPLFGPPDIRRLEAKRDAQGLIKALTFKDAAIRIAAAEALAPMKDPQAVEPLVGLLKDDHSGVRLAAVAALSARGGFRVVEPLVSALDDANPDVRTTAATAVYRRLMADPDNETRWATATALGRIREATAVEPLVKAIMDADESVRVAAIKALQAIGDIAAVLPLTVALAHEQARQKSGRSSLAVERATGKALDVLCDERAIESLEAGLSHDDADVREIAVRRLARIGSPLVAAPLAASLADEDPVIRRSAARGLSEIGWQPPADEIGARYWAALREWRRCAEIGLAAVPLLLSSFDHVDALEQGDIVAALVALHWEPAEANTLAAHYWAAQNRWEKCIEMGGPALEALDRVTRSAPKWRDRMGAAAALVELGQPRTAPFARLDLVQRIMTILDSDQSGEDRRGLLEALLSDERQFDPAVEEIEWCNCGYPAYKVRNDRLREPLSDLLGFEQSSNNARIYYCPSCDTRRGTVGA